MPKVIAVRWDGTVWSRYPESKQRAHRVYYSGWWRGVKTSLHRAKWITLNGPIPKGMEVSHKNGNALDNSIGNLQCLTVDQHRKHDGKLGAYSGPKTQAVLAAARPAGMIALKKWHRENKEQARANSALSSVKAEKRDLICQQCEAEFQSIRPWAMYCSVKCGTLANPFQPKHPYKCRWCGKEGLAKKKDKEYCNHRCSAFGRHAARRARQATGATT